MRIICRGNFEIIPAKVNENLILKRYVLGKNQMRMVCIKYLSNHQSPKYKFF